MSEEATIQEQPKKRKRGFCCSLIACGCLLPLLILFVLPFFLLSCSTRTPLPALDVNDTMSQSIIASQIYVQILQAQHAGETMEIIVTPEQLDSLARIAHHAVALRLKAEKDQGNFVPVDPSGISIEYKNNAVELRAELTVPEKSLPLALPIFASAVPYADKLTEGITVHRAKIGAITVPAVLVESRIEAFLNDLRKEDIFRKLRPAVDSVSVEDDGSLRIVYRPYFFKEYLDEIKSRM